MSDVMQTATPDSHEEKTVTDNAGVVLTTGDQLAASRQAKNWTIQFVAEQLKLSQVQIVALEANNFDALPKMVIVRGFVRAYAKLLKVDGDVLVAGLPRDTEPVQLETSLRPALSTPFVDSRLSLQGQHDNNRRYLIGAAMLLLIVGLFLLLQATDLGKGLGKMWGVKETPSVPSSIAEPVSNVSSSSNGSGSSNESIVSADPANSALDSNRVTPPNASVESSASVATVIVEKSSLNSGVTSTSPDKSLAPANNSDLKTPANVVVNNGASPTAAQATGIAGSTVKPATLNSPSATELLVLKFRQDSWVQVKTESGSILSSHLAKAGTEESFSVKQTLNVKIGNVAGVEAVLRGEPLSISSERGSNVANLTVK